MKNVLRFLGYVPVILVTILGAYLVFHMWRLSEAGQNTKQHEEAAAGGNHQ